MKILLKEIINFFFILFLLPFCLLIFFSKYKRVANSDLVIYHNTGGFGHTFTAQDLIRYIFPNKKIVYLQFYDPSRFNKYLNKIFDHEKIILPTSIYFSFVKKKFGEYEGSFFKIIEFTILFFVKKKISINEFYAEVEKKYQNTKLKKISMYRWVDIYFNLIKNNNKKVFFLPNKYLSDKKICTIYLRQKFNKTDFTDSARSGSSDPRVYFDMIKYLIKKNYIINLIGDDVFGKKDIMLFQKQVGDYRSFNLSKKYFQIYAAVNCDLFIAETGGGHWFGLYAKKSILINCLPYGYKPFNFKKILYKKVLDHKNVVMSHKKANKIFHLSYEKIKNYKVINNSSKELLTLIKSVI